MRGKLLKPSCQADDGVSFTFPSPSPCPSPLGRGQRIAAVENLLPARLPPVRRRILPLLGGEGVSRKMNESVV